MEPFSKSQVFLYLSLSTSFLYDSTAAGSVIVTVEPLNPGESYQ